MEDIISMADMGAIFSVTDTFGVDREHIRVDLEKADPGSARLGSGGMVEIVAPLTPYAVELRYDFEFWPTKEAGQAARTAAIAVRDVIVARLT